MEPVRNNHFFVHSLACVKLWIASSDLPAGSSRNDAGNRLTKGSYCTRMRGHCYVIAGAKDSDSNSFAWE